MTSTPKRGQLVQVLVDPSTNSGSDIAIAIVTKAWSTNLVDLRPFLNTTHSSTLDSYTSVPFLQNEQEVRDTIEGIVEERKKTYGNDHVVDMKHVNYAFPLDATPDPDVAKRLDTAERNIVFLTDHVAQLERAMVPAPTGNPFVDQDSDVATPAPAVDGTTFNSRTADLGNGVHVPNPTYPMGDVA